MRHINLEYQESVEQVHYKQNQENRQSMNQILREYRRSDRTRVALSSM
jgi:hypothetical protein